MNKILFILKSLSLFCGIVQAAFGADPTFTHGSQICTQNVGLAGVGNPTLTRVSALGKPASALANSTDPATGLKRLYRLDIADRYVNVDIPCVIEQCRITVAGTKQGWYCLDGTQLNKSTVRDCDLYGPIGPDSNGKDSVVGCTINGAALVQRCLSIGGEDGIHIGGKGLGCVVEDSLIAGLVILPGGHSDAVQMTAGIGDYDAWVLRRCRIEGPYRNETASVNLTSSAGEISGVTLQDCFLSGGTYTAYARKPGAFNLSKLRVTGCIWESGSTVYGMLSVEKGFSFDDWSNNQLTTLSNRSLELPVPITNLAPFELGK